MMGICKYSGKKGTGYGIDYSFKGKRIGERVGSDKTQRKEAPIRAMKTRSGATVNREMACLRAMFNKAVKRGMIPKHPASQVKAFKEASGRNCFLSVDEAGRLLEACSRHLRPIVLCALETGMRRAEILRLRWNDIRTEWKAWQKSVTNMESEKEGARSTVSQLLEVEGV
jgi:integrase